MGIMGMDRDEIVNELMLLRKDYRGAIDKIDELKQLLEAAKQSARDWHKKWEAATKPVTNHCPLCEQYAKDIDAMQRKLERVEALAKFVGEMAAGTVPDCHCHYDASHVYDCGVGRARGFTKGCG